MKRCTLGVTSIPAVVYTCSSLTTPTRSGGPKPSTTEYITPDKPGVKTVGQECVRVCYEIDGRKERSKKRKFMGCPLLGKGQRDLT